MHEQSPVEYIDPFEQKETLRPYQESALKLREHIDRVDMPSRHEEGEFLLGYGSPVLFYNEDLGTYGNKLTVYEWEVVEDPDSPDPSGKAFSGNHLETTVLLKPNGQLEYIVISEQQMREDGTGVASTPTVRITFRNGEVAQAGFSDTNTINGEVKVLSADETDVLTQEALTTVLDLTSTITEHPVSEAA